MLDVVPGQEAEHREDGKEEILAETEHVEEVAKPHVGAVAGRTAAEEKHAPFVREDERERENEARERHPR